MGRWRWALLMAAACGNPDHVPPDAAIDAPGDAATVSVRILAFNDFHGALEASSSPPSAGAARLATAIVENRTANTIVVAAGDIVGGSPLLSAAFHDEPTIAVMNAIGLDYASIGNHELDEGATELARLQHGGCHPTDGCQLSSTFTGAKFTYLAANMTNTQTMQRPLPGFVVREIGGGARIAIVGMTLEATAAYTLSSAIPELHFGDEADTMNALLPAIEAAGARTVVLVVHEGGVAEGGPNGCDNLRGRIVDIVGRLPDAVAVVASAHTHRAYNCQLGERVLTSAGSHGNLLTAIDLEIDPGTQTVLSAVAKNIDVAASSPDGAIATIVADVSAKIAPIRDRVVATITADLAATSPAGEREMGDVIADAMLEAGAPHSARAAIMNYGGVRAPLLYARSGPETVDGQVTYGEAFAVQPFSNLLSAADASGAEIVSLLDVAATSGTPAQVAGMSYTWRPAATPRVTAADVIIDGAPLDPGATYRIVVNAIFLERLPNAANVVGLGVDLDRLLEYLAAHSPVPAPALDRITVE